MALYTVILDFQGGTYVAQVHARSATAAVIAWARSRAPGEIQGLGAASLKTLEQELGKDTPVALDGLKNVWCQSALLRGKLALLNIVRTSD